MIVFQKNDSKYRSLGVELKKLGIESDAVQGSPIKTPLFLIWQVLRGRSIKVYVFRYLNDYSSGIRTALRFLSEISTILICKIFGIQIWWLCHNVDKESTENFPRVTAYRRKIINQNSKRILTTNKLLIPHAVRAFGHTNISSISLGYIGGKVYDDLYDISDINSDLERWLQQQKKENNIILYCAGSHVSKALHFGRVKQVLDQLNQQSNLKFYALVVGAKVEESDFIYNISKRYFVHPDLIKQYVDYYYRVIDDYSISYTLYEAAYFEKPILTENFGILPNIIQYYKLGGILDSENINKVMCELEKNYNPQKFLRENNWEKAAQTLAKFYSVDCDVTAE